MRPAALSVHRAVPAGVAVSHIDEGDGWRKALKWAPLRYLRI